jgi:hypothetical protein
MSSRTLFRLAGIALLLAGVFQAVGTALHPDDSSPTRYFADPRWAPAHVALALSFLLAIFGFVGLYLRQRVETGALGLVGFVLAVAGCALLVADTLAEAFLLPVIAANQPPRPLADWLDLSGPLAGAVVVSLVSLLTYTAGFVLLGIATERAGVFPRRAGALLAVAAILSNGEFFGPVGFITYVGAGILLGVTLAWLGTALWQTSSQSIGRPTLGRHDPSRREARE